MTDFFGKLSPFEILTAVVAFVTATWTLYREVFERAQLTLYSGNAASLVVHADSREASELVLSGAVANSGAVLGVVTDISATVTDPTGCQHEYFWALNVNPRNPDSFVVTHSPASVVAVPAHESRPFHIVLRHTSPEHDHEWVHVGTYRVSISAWCGRTRPRRPHATLRVEFDVSDPLSMLASAGQQRVLSVAVRR